MGQHFKNWTIHGMFVLPRQDLLVTPDAFDRVNDLNLQGATNVRVTGPTDAWELTGMAGGEDGRVVILRHASPHTLTIKNENANSSAVNRILTLDDSPYEVTITGKGAAIFQYDGQDERWWLINIHG